MLKYILLILLFVLLVSGNKLAFLKIQSPLLISHRRNNLLTYNPELLRFWQTSFASAYTMYYIDILWYSLFTGCWLYFTILLHHSHFFLIIADLLPQLGNALYKDRNYVHRQLIVSTCKFKHKNIFINSDDPK